ncbi:uncharacterized protein LOC143567777 [Bidens hawaiensis]|uniref:uncharacterized protein LOC143567777 n=1 Tax=Bidens hawaiensis TaxID=980011 RepID=UPI00404B757B
MTVKLEAGMEEGLGNNTTSDRYAKILTGSWWAQFRYESNPWMARYVYSVMFLLANLLAWAVRDYGGTALTQMSKLKTCEGGEDCLGTQGVLRVSMGCFIFFFIMFVSTSGTKKLHGRKELWHSSWWSVKIILMIILVVLPFFLPTQLILAYGSIAHFGAGVFLFIQLISIIRFITWLNERCLSEKYAERCHTHFTVIAIGEYFVCILGIILMYIWYTPQLSCVYNIAFITWTLFLLQLMTSVSLHPKVRAGFLTPGLMGLYIVFLCWSAIRSEPPDNKCTRTWGASRHWLTIISFVIALVTMVIATFSIGINYKCFQRGNDEKQEEDDVPYCFGFFHLVFASGVMYFAMLLIGWNSHHTMAKWTIDVGWTSTWVRIVNEWLAVCVYLWMLVEPIVWKGRQVEETK